jgi:two-component system sensor histidine kinase BaeS
MTSLRTRLLAAIGVTVLLSVALTLGVAGLLTRAEVQRAALRELGHRADVLAERERDALLPLGRLESINATLESREERVFAAPLVGPTQYLDAGEQRDLRHGRPVDGRRGDVYYAARPVAGKVLVLQRPTRLDAETSRPFLLGLAAAGLAALVLGGIAALLLARAIARPVARVVRATNALAAERSPDPVPLEGAAELRSLAASFNEMAEKLSRARAAERNFLLSVSHELKTPLTSIRGYAEAMRDGAIDADEGAPTIEAEATRLERLVRDLLDVARMNRSEFQVERRPIDLASVAKEAARRYRSQAETFGVSLELDTNGGAPAVGDEERALQVVSNLVENALRVTPPDGRVVVRACAGELTVEDTGPGLAQEELPRAFERFYLWSRYGGTRRVGTGLGLAIVKQLTEQMGGTVAVESAPGATRFTVRLPVLPPLDGRPNDG